ncbi:MAG: T9SS type A sorting domain-containing protein [Ignavibacteria bacterium]|nr:T9SS type A sorting domain-containing protein [Ignavibacteria bacterium]
MKIGFLKLSLVLFLFLFLTDSPNAQTNPTYTLTAKKNFTFSSSDSIVFDIYLLHTNSGSTNFEYALGQYYFNFNTNIANGGNLTYKIISSELPSAAVPRNPTIFNNQLRLVTNSVLGAGNGPAISNNSPGTLIVRMSLRTSAATFAAGEGLNLEWRNLSAGNPFTKLFAYVGTLNTEITASSNHFIENLISVNQISSVIPTEFKLNQNYPNPFNPSTRINYVIPERSFVSLKIYDISGKEISSVVNQFQNAGMYEATFDGASLASGVYYYRLKVSSGQTTNFTQVKKMILVK